MDFVHRHSAGRLVSWLALSLACTTANSLSAEARAERTERIAAGSPIPGLVYTNDHPASDEPLSIHVVRLARRDRNFEFHSLHAKQGALGLSLLTEQIAALAPSLGQPVAAINGDFYQRDRAYAGAARGLQVCQGELLSAPSGSASFWIDPLGEPRATNVTSRFQITWPDGSITAFGLNRDRPANGVVLYTPAVGASTRTEAGCELILERSGTGGWLPLRLGRSISARVREVRRAGNTALAKDILVLSLGPSVAARFESVKPGDLLGVETGSWPVLRGIRTAISGGPVLVHGGKKVRIRSSPDEAYELSSMLERHPRSAVGWNRDWLFLVEVDGRQRDVSVGMTLDELSRYLLRLGCEEAMNLDGGGSAMLWCQGTVRNSPCDGYERTIANSLVVVHKAAAAQTSKPGALPGVQTMERSAAP